jgi:hypothetical protein
VTPVTIKILSFFMFGIFWGTFQFVGFLSRFWLKKNGCYLYARVVGDGVVWWLLETATHAVQCDALSLSLCVSLCVYIYMYIYIHSFIYLFYVGLYWKEWKHGGAAGRLFASYQDTRRNESRKSAEYFTKYCASQTAEGVWDCSIWLHGVINCNVSISGFFISFWLF